MTRYFFDIKTETSVEHDYSGKDFLSLDHARQVAELIAMDVGCTRVDGAFPTDVQIRDAAGRLLLSVTIPPIDALAA